MLPLSRASVNFFNAVNALGANAQYGNVLVDIVKTFQGKTYKLGHLPVQTFR
jgi:hypothetical protein